MYQISYSIKMIDDPEIDIYAAEKRKCQVYAAALTASIIVAVTMTIGLISLTIKDQSKFENYCMLVTYVILPCIYIWTYISLQKALKGLLETEIDTERRSVLFQFFFFLLSYVTRLPFFFWEAFFFTGLGGSKFWWQLTTVLLYIPWSILPIGYILWCH